MLNIPNHNLYRRLASLDQGITELERQMAQMSVAGNTSFGSDVALWRSARALDFMKAHRLVLAQLHARKCVVPA